MNSSVYEVMQKNRSSIEEAWQDKMLNFREEERELSNVTKDVFLNSNTEFINNLMKHVVEQRSDVGPDLQDFFERTVQIGWPLSYVTKGLQVFRRIGLKTIINDKEDLDEVMDTFDAFDRSVDNLFEAIVSYSTQNWRNTVSVQKKALLELSAPLIPVFENISVMPLIGTIDTERAKLIMENLLDGVIENRSQVVLIDITGVPVVDTMVAHHIIQAAEAVRLIGSKCILVGIRPEIAQTIVNLGIDLSDFPTRSTLLKGIESALEITNKKIETLS
ncbi:STAS domain-containing protein [Pseudalkalibacillus berkeleyi]|uniref:STAS domain-containing protein n=1 Tax=Pseudalkalibacillus berkeleyi TaxID=1069813 RepID=A0ABS9H5G3_9BACL|nr:STAS domain-containing protein [Pseudalkalibacillus berkeleyi]MCF6139351.1 STAS domain-containing protein [Pseudalkalibacillus berkeleyi]